jgi:hypothetical protein
MALLDICQIFSEQVEEDSPFELEVVLTDPVNRRQLIKGQVRWYRLSEPEADVRHFRAGLHLKDTESQAITRRLSVAPLKSQTLLGMKLL